MLDMTRIPPKANEARWPAGHRAGVAISEGAERSRSYLMDYRQYNVFG